MKTLQTQYNLIKEGKGHKDVFVKEAKRLFPDVIPNGAGFDQTSTLLKNKNIIAENIFPLIPSSGLNPFSTFDKFLSEEVKEVKAEEKKTSKEVEEDLSKIYDIYDKKNLDNQIFDQVLNGIRFELEQDSELSLEKATEKVKKNLAKNSLYYLENAAFGVKGLGYTKEAPGLGEPKELKGKYKSSGYGDLKENKINEETQKYLVNYQWSSNPYSNIGTTNTEVVEASSEKEAISKVEKALKEKNRYVGKDVMGEPIITAKPMENKISFMANEIYNPSSDIEYRNKTLKNKMKLVDLLKEGVHEDLKEADKIGEVAALEAKINFLEGKIKKCYETMTLFEKDEIKEFVDKKRQSEIKKEVKILERAKVQLEKKYDRLKGTVEEMDDTIDESDYDY